MKCTIPKIKKSKYANGSSYWLVTYSLDGKQKKKKFSTEREANEHKQDVIRKHHGGISTADHDLARLALEKFKAHQTGNQDLANIDLVQLVEWACSNYQAPTGETVENLVAEFLDIKRKQGKRESTIYELETYLNAFAKDFKGRKPETFTQAELERYLNKTYTFNKNRFGNIKHFFAWLGGTSKATPNRNPILKDTPFRGYIIGRKDDDKVSNIVSFNADECVTILEVAAKHNAQAMFSYMLYSGMRPEETFRMWDDVQKYGWNIIDLEKRVISIPASVAKTRAPRLLEISNTLAAWLEHYKHLETLMPYNWSDKYTAVRKESKVSMVKDVTRHTFITQMVKQGWTIDDIALQCGNSRRIILRHYATLSSKEDSDKFFALTPDKFDEHDLTPDEYKAKMVKQRDKNLGKQRDKVKKMWDAKKS